MKITIDTDNRIISVEQDVLMKTLIENLNKLFPNLEWECFTLQTNTFINTWYNPIIIDRVKPIDYPTYPWITSSGNQLNFNYDSGTYNVQI